MKKPLLSLSGQVCTVGQLDTEALIGLPTTSSGFVLQMPNGRSVAVTGLTATEARAVSHAFMKGTALLDLTGAPAAHSAASSDVVVCACGGEHAAASWAGDFMAASGQCPTCTGRAAPAPRLTDAEIDAVAARMPGGPESFMKHWGYRQFAREILELRAMPAWEPSFDCMLPGQEQLVQAFCAEIAGPRGRPGRLPDPVRLLEMAEQLYQAERKTTVFTERRTEAPLPQPLGQAG